MPSASGKPVPQTGKLAIVAIAVLGVVFFGVMQFSKKRLQAPSPHTPSVVVLPSRVFGDADKMYMADAVPGSLSTLLGRVPGLGVRTPPSSFANTAPDNLSQAAATAQAATIVTSTVTAEADDLTLNVQLVDPETRATLWSRQCKGTLRDYNELIRQAAEGVVRTLVPSSPQLTSTAGLGTSSEAELAERQGEYYFARFNQLHNGADSDQALNAFHLALALDPALKNAADRIAQLSPGKH